MGVEYAALTKLTKLCLYYSMQTQDKVRGFVCAALYFLTTKSYCNIDKLVIQIHLLNVLNVVYFSLFLLIQALTLRSLRCIRLLGKQTVNAS